MFSGCKILNCVDLSRYDTQLVTDMRNMFANCEKLKTIFLILKKVRQCLTNSRIQKVKHCLTFFNIIFRRA